MRDDEDGAVGVEARRPGREVEVEEVRPVPPRGAGDQVGDWGQRLGAGGEPVERGAAQSRVPSASASARAGGRAGAEAQEHRVHSLAAEAAREVHGVAPHAPNRVEGNEDAHPVAHARTRCGSGRLRPGRLARSQSARS
jgi:hypothetical protein